MKLMASGWSEFESMLSGGANGAPPLWLLGVAVLGCLAIMKGTASALRATEPGWFRVGLALVAGAVVAIVALGAAREFGLIARAGGHERLVRLLIGALALLAVAVPLVAGLTRSGYMHGLLMWLFGCLAGLVLIVAVNGVRELVRSGDRDVERVKSRTGSMQRFLNP